MPYRPPRSDDFNHAAWLRRTFKFAPQFDPLISRFSEGIRVHSKLSDRSDVRRNIQVCIGVILANLYNTHIRDENRWIIVDRSNDGYRTGSYNPIKLGVRAIRGCISFLVEEGYIEERGGNFDIALGVGYTSRFRSRERLINEIEEYIFADTIQEVSSKGIIRNTLTDNPNSILIASLFVEDELPLVRLKGEKPSGGGSAPLLEYQPNEQTISMEGHLRDYNRFLTEDHWIDLLIPDVEFQALSRRRDNEPDEFGDSDDDRWELDLLGRRNLYRVFNNGNFEEGGRFYGGWWQRVPSHQRKFLTINWFPTAELDYSNMQVAMLYADKGLPLTADAYAIDGIPPAYRKLIKRTVFKIINADGQVRAPLKAELPDGWSWPQILAAVRERHAPIAEHFGTGEGIRLQRRDADIAEEVMLTMKAEGKLVLPIHDSFIVEEGHQARLKEVMIDVYRRHLRVEIAIDDSATWFADLPEDAEELAHHEVRDYEDWLDEVEVSPAYTNYRQRRSDFIKYKGEDWGHTHHWRK